MPTDNQNSPKFVIQETPYFFVFTFTIHALALASVLVFVTPTPFTLPTGFVLMSLGAATVILAVAQATTLVLLHRSQRQIRGLQSSAVTSAAQQSAEGEALQQAVTPDAITGHTDAPLTTADALDRLAIRVNQIDSAVQRLTTSLTIDNDATQVDKETTSIPAATPHLPLIAIDGIGDKLAARMTLHGIFSTADLVHASTTEVAEAGDVGPETAHNWQRQAELMAALGLEGHEAAALVLAGIDNVPKLEQGNARSIASSIQGAAKNGHVAHVSHIDEATVKSWIANAHTLGKHEKDLIRATR